MSDSKLLADVLRDDMGYWWKKTNDPMPADARHVFTSANPAKDCNGVGLGMGAAGCAFPNEGSELSPAWGTMILPPNPSRDLVQHEHKHLDGYIHPDDAGLLEWLRRLGQ